MVYKRYNIVFPSEKTLNQIRDINNTIESLLYSSYKILGKIEVFNDGPARDSFNKFNKALDNIEESIKCIKCNVKIIEIEPNFYNFFGIKFFYLEADLMQDNPKDTIDKRFVKLALKLWDLGVRPIEN